mgnify:CR=1 FL=1
MAITAYTGPPGAGKSYAMVSQVIVDGLAKGRRVVTNIEGLSPEKARAYVARKHKLPLSEVGQLVLFEGRQALEAGFFPTGEISDEHTFIKGGDLLVFDEWKLVFPVRGQTPPECHVEAFLRWHRHLVDEAGRASDVVIGTQLITDIHRDYRGLVERSYKFKNLKGVGLRKGYVADCYEGHTQPKGGSYRTINGRYKPEIFELYQSYSTEGEASEEQTDSRAMLFGKSIIVFVVLGLIVVAAALYFIVGFFGRASAGPAEAAPRSPAETARPVSARPTSPYRIVGHMVGDSGVRVIIGDDRGTLRVMRPDGFQFDNGRPVSGWIDGVEVVAKDRLYIEQEKPVELRQ